MINSKEVIKSLSMILFCFILFSFNLYVANWDFIQTNRELKWVTNLQRAMIKAQKNSQFIFTICSDVSFVISITSLLQGATTYIIFVIHKLQYDTLLVQTQ